MDEAQFKQFMDMMQKSLDTFKTPPTVQVTSQTSVPIILSFDQFKPEVESFTQYRKRFDNFVDLKGISTNAELVRKTFLNSAGSEIFQKAESLAAPATLESLTYKDIADKLENALSPKPHPLVQQHRFLSTVQNSKQTVGEFVTELRKFIPTCNFNCSCGLSIADNFLMAQIVRGVINPQIRDKLFSIAEKELNCQKVESVALAAEAARLNTAEIAQNGITRTQNENSSLVQSTAADVKAISGTQKGSYSQRSRSRSRPRFNPVNRHHSKSRQNFQSKRMSFKELGIDGLCVRCARSGHDVKDCRTDSQKVKCNLCNRTGHVAKVCISTLVKSKREAKLKYIDIENEPFTGDDVADFNSLFDMSHLEQHMKVVDLATVSTISRDTEKIFVDVYINNKQQRFEVDCGCGYTLISETEFSRIGALSELQPIPILFRCYDGGILKPRGYTLVTVKYKNKVSFKEPLIVVPAGRSPVLGRAWIRHLGINLEELDNDSGCDSNVYTVEPITASEIEKKFPQIFIQSVGKIPDVKCSLELRQGAKPVFSKPRDIPYAIRDAVEKELDELERDNVITKIEKSDWGSALVPIVKPDGSVRLCVDYKVTVNPRLVDCHYPIPKIDELISQLRGSRYYCKIDLFKAYLHVEMDDESANIQAISTHRGTYRMNRLAFGIKSAPGQWHRILHQILQDLKGVAVYFDDIVVHGKTIAECTENLLSCLQRLSESNLHINVKKCQFFQTKISYVGYVIEGDKICKDPTKVEAIIEAPRPQNAHETKQFLGLITYYSRFIPNVSSITYPIRQLSSNSRNFKWSASCESAFIKLKNEIASDRVLIPYDPSLPVSLACDASPTGVAGVLSHTVNGVERPIAFVSRSLNPAERNYSQLDREALAIVFAIDKFFVYLFGRKFILITDNRPLTHIFHQNNKLPPLTAARLLRYASYLAGFDYEIQHRKNEDHVNVDYFSRFSLTDTKPTPNQQILDHQVVVCQEQSLNQISSSQFVTSSTIRMETGKDPVLSRLREELISESNSKNIDFSILDDVIFRGHQVYIPESLRTAILEELHTTHIGIVKMKQLARRYCYWPTMNVDIERTVRSCEQCAVNQKVPAKDTTHKWDEPSNNFDRIHIDYAGPKYGFHYFILVDAKSKWPEIRIQKRAPTTEATIQLIEDIAATHGYPRILVSDNASIFTCDEFIQYCRSHGIHNSFTAPGHPATNGLAERYVQILKSKLMKMENEGSSMIDCVRKILQRFRATPLACGKSPAELYLGRPMRIRLDAIKPFIPPKNESRQSSAKRSFQVGDRVTSRFYRNGRESWTLGSIQKRIGKIHYWVKLDNGYQLKRHIDQLRSTLVPDSTPPPTITVPEKKVVRWGETKFEFITPNGPVAQRNEDNEVIVADVTEPPSQISSVPPNQAVGVRRSTRKRQLPLKYRDNAYM